ncbi:PE-PPE domain-containing protein [Mycolicibacterium mengxianglii]|uniref:PE-PPE domain-containing protein n=1 Tax=Mycolicibacterium mengxianglii TaxID=2736649 RepID=UPI0018D07EEE|nr:PE-PPE domain-containing protein [Mycolicibacterium mengxianglii]
MRAFIRSFFIGLVAVVGAAALAIGSTLTGAVVALADPVALIMGNSGRPWPEASYVANAMRRFIEPNSVCGDVTCEARNVYGPEEFWPVYGGLTALTFNQSTEEGLDYLDAALQQQLHAAPGEKVVIFGYSQSGRITNLQLRNLADPDYAVGNDNIVPDADQLEIVLVGNWSRPNGGIGSRFNGITIPILDITFDGPTPTDTGYQMTDIAYEYDIIADAPLYPVNLLATANAALGFFYAHLTYADPSATGAAFPWGSNSEASFEELLASGTVQKYPGKDDDPNGNPEDWDNTYVLIPSKHLPLLQPIRDLGKATGTTNFVEPLMLLVEPTLKVLIDTGYDRTIPMGQNTPARLIPLVNPVTLATDLVGAVGKGVSDAVSYRPPTAPTERATVPAASEKNTADEPAAKEQEPATEVTSPRDTTPLGSTPATSEDGQEPGDAPGDAKETGDLHQPLKAVERGFRDFADHVGKALKPRTPADNGAGTGTDSDSDTTESGDKAPRGSHSKSKTEPDHKVDNKGAKKDAKADKSDSGAAA